MTTNFPTTVELGCVDQSASLGPEKRATEPVSVPDSNNTQKETEIESTQDMDNKSLLLSKKSNISQKENIAQSTVFQTRENAHLMYESETMCHQKFSNIETESSKSESFKDVDLSSALPLSVEKNKQKSDEKLNNIDNKSDKVSDMSSSKKQNDLKKESKSSASMTGVHTYLENEEVEKIESKFKITSDPMNSNNVPKKSPVELGTTKSTKISSDPNAKENDYVEINSVNKCKENSEENVNKKENENTPIAEKVPSQELNNFKKQKKSPTETTVGQSSNKNLNKKEVESESENTSDPKTLNSAPETATGEKLYLASTAKEKDCDETDSVDNCSVEVDEKENKIHNKNTHITDELPSQISDVSNNLKKIAASNTGEHSFSRSLEMKKVENKPEITNDPKTSNNASETPVEYEISEGKNFSSYTNVKENDYAETGTAYKCNENYGENLNKIDNENIQITNKIETQEPNLSNNDKKPSSSTTEKQNCTENQEVKSSASKSGTTDDQREPNNATVISAVESEISHSKSRTSGSNENKKTSQHSADLDEQKKTAIRKIIGPGCDSQNKNLFNIIPRGLKQRMYNKHILKCVMMIPYGFSGQLIGHKGSTIKKLSKESLTHIHLDLKYFYGPCDELKAIISGSPYQCSEAIKKILNLIRKAEYFKQYPLKLFISQEYLGGIIGNQGRFLAETKKVSGVDLIKIFPTWPKTKKHGVLVIKHKEELTCIKAVKMCLNRLHFLQMNNSDQKRTHCQVLLPEDKVSYVIGKGGSNIERSKIYGVYLSVNHANKKGEQWLTMKTAKGGMVRALRYLFNKSLKGLNEVSVKMPYNDSRQELVVQKQSAACDLKPYPQVTPVNNAHGNISSFLIKGSSNSVLTAVGDILYAI